MLNKVQELWELYGFEFFVVVSLMILLTFSIAGICRSTKKILFPTYIPYIKKPKFFNSSFVPKRTNQESKGEAECRRVLEMIFKKKFSKIRPDFLKNNVTGGMYNLELDCYNPELRLAVEYNGAQHYKYIPYFHKNKEAFLNQKYRDEIKRHLCRNNSVILIEVPHNVPNERIQNFLIDKLRLYKFIN